MGAIIPIVFIIKELLFLEMPDLLVENTINPNPIAESTHPRTVPVIAMKNKLIAVAAIKITLDKVFFSLKER